MGEHREDNLLKLGDQLTSDVVVRLINKKGRSELYHSHSSILKSKSKYFADRLLNTSSHTCVDIECTEFDYDHYVELLKRLYLPAVEVLDSWDSVQSALGVLQAAATLNCEAIVHNCIQYLEAVPWEDSEEGEIVQVVAQLGPIAMPILARIQPVELSATKGVLISAIRFATSTDGPCPPFGDDLRISAQEQIDYMLGDDEDMPLVAADNEVKLETKIGLSNMFSLFERELSTSDITCTAAENKILQSLSDLEWMCNILPKMGLMDEFVFKWIDISDNVLLVIEDKKLESIMWGLKVKLVEVTSKVLDAVGYGNVILPAPRRVQLLKSWLPFIRKLKPILDSMINKDIELPYKMDEDMCQSIEGAIVSLVLALPSDDQADILADWMNTEHLRYPDLSEAFEAVPTTDLNRNTEWFTYPGVWTTYILILFFSWLMVLSVFGCSPGMAWTIVHLSHFIITYHFFHWKKGTPFAEDQGIYNRLTWWEQIDNGKQLTRNRKFLLVVPVVLYLIASHTTDYQHPMLFFNTLAVFILVVAKFPHMHKVRIFGINADQ